MTIFSFTIPTEKENLTPLIDKLVKKTGTIYHVKSVANGVYYELEFNSIKSQVSFKNELNKYLPDLFR